MNAAFSRRKLIQAAGVVALPFPATAAAMMSGPRHEGTDTPKICLEVGARRPRSGRAEPRPGRVG